MNIFASHSMRGAAVAVLLSLAVVSFANAAAPIVDPFAQEAAGWGPALGGGLMASRWAEEHADEKSLAVSAELRLRQVGWRNALGKGPGDVSQDQLRAVLGANWRPHRAVRLFGELASGQVEGDSANAAANFRNALSVQQLFVDLRGQRGSVLAGVMAGRQEFADGPRQLMSLSDGPNLHRSWNGVRVYVHDNRWRLGAFDLRATRLGPGRFDESVAHDESLQGLNASVAVAGGSAGSSYIDAFWFHSRQPIYRVAGRIGQDDRQTAGARFWGRRGALKFDWTLVRQSGSTVDDRPIEAWGLFATHGITLSESGWKPRLTSRVDLGSGGGAWGSGTVHTFNPLYASSSYVSEGQLLSLGNLVMVAPGIAVSPTPRSTLSFEYGHARRMDARDAVYATATRAYTGTQDAPGHHVGDLLRLGATWAPDPRISLRLNIEHLRAGGVLRRAGHASASFAFLDLTLRY
jgi:hypothetical protein